MEHEFSVPSIESPKKLPEVLSLNALNKETSSIYPCPYCPFAFATEKELKLHLHENYDNGANVEETKIVDDTNSSCEESENELSGDFKYICEDCERGFISMRGLKQHTGKMHDMSKKPYACDYCGKKFKIKYALSTHMKTCNKISRKYQNVKFK
ncbi:unnamed protein product [Blepharisma stoltei]|uniref:C2H2-type domain-containing protein n=1 Tax=Blepharisma stoltei TaxID=1481888 RepID=A0AAU9K0Y0_9CILI|nr:unnamed protein product [Blepharisma stoltei]